MKLNKKLALVLPAAAALALVAGTGAAMADDGNTYVTSTNLVACDTVEVIDIPILSSADNFVDCSKEVDIDATDVELEFDVKAGKIIAKKEH
jgi:hypothetical protein